VADKLPALKATFLATVAQTTKLTGAACNRYTFRTALNDGQYMNLITSDLASNQQLKSGKWAILAADYEFGRDAAATFKNQSGAQIVSEDYAGAAIASELAASMYDLKVVRERIEDQVNNFTRFLVIGKKLADKSGADKTSLMFSVKDEVGILYRMLEPFSKRGINLSKIESRPLKKKAWEYIFFLDLVGHISDPEVAEAVQELKGCCQFVKVLGSYPRAK